MQEGHLPAGGGYSKAHKPLIERRRRERINRSLEELKILVLHSLNRDERDYTRMEKADILEMTVRFLRDVHNSDHNLPQVSPKYTDGFNQCAANVMWYLNRSPDVAPGLRFQLLQRLALGLQRVHSNAVYERPPEVVGPPPTRERHHQRRKVQSEAAGRTNLYHVMPHETDAACDLSTKRSEALTFDSKTVTADDFRPTDLAMVGRLRASPKNYDDIGGNSERTANSSSALKSSQKEGNLPPHPPFICESVWRPF